MSYLLFAHPQQEEAKKLDELINLIIIFTHRWKTQTLLTNKQVNAFDVNIATLIIMLLLYICLRHYYIFLIFPKTKIVGTR